MKAKTTISISEARKKIFDIAEEVQKPNNYYTFTEKGRPKAVLMSASDFEDIMEDMEILGDPEFMDKIKKAEDEFKRGEYVTLEKLKKELRYESGKGYSVVAEKSDKKNKETKNTRHKKKK
ncbi:MAG: hypothetical protein A3G52_03045 [Candidatus Taylorbacteria bacterium RIFCSPLOWO2_12_FULL_43_20]|uniref:Antitoxin n=1 Tax=Candidatus Taylorbacteria bacterium RIFCSPLOWO2_12_FULL_43_20 TaxID=1802332 RepID=A0A1G2P336_9BACT|nr:MAG: hypothetical protein A2825_03800 [Candidatus Taylorbacteria bacterium RIFCSPHIGHO2_01_FULL_43_120]OHA22069.1 MAG: hypothetical protein A3B98_04185 [Candidatus Taylorbacteria bacterium RIFCSPHIGHO2_02_FULL_43_55]OHA28186.1 MAG: hypothetical protein A3E92_02185 [Candidatus Taylorbacteria bacterium RIFCSPHIGHO2_12_FULL_42_34]OHA31042.1 MAG: hypothetical protein A3B09_04130 [Candidatus Taylorbacteria bacterium RIFCSPLOWO2_01_FULL_43_83]OHA39722.1 MAG: hypothetical protein A3H58_04670 [Candi